MLCIISNYMAGRRAGRFAAAALLCLLLRSQALAGGPELQVGRGADNEHAPRVVALRGGEIATWLDDRSATLYSVTPSGADLELWVQPVQGGERRAAGRLALPAGFRARDRDLVVALAGSRGGAMAVVGSIPRTVVGEKFIEVLATRIAGGGGPCGSPATFRYPLRTPGGLYVCPSSDGSVWLSFGAAGTPDLVLLSPQSTGEITHRAVSIGGGERSGVRSDRVTILAGGGGHRMPDGRERLLVRDGASAMLVDVTTADAGASATMSGSLCTLRDGAFGNLWIARGVASVSYRTASGARKIRCWDVSAGVRQLGEHDLPSGAFVAGRGIVAPGGNLLACVLPKASPGLVLLQQVRVDGDTFEVVVDHGPLMSNVPSDIAEEVGNFTGSPSGKVAWWHWPGKNVVLVVDTSLARTARFTAAPGE